MLLEAVQEVVERESAEEIMAEVVQNIEGVPTEVGILMNGVERWTN